MEEPPRQVETINEIVSRIANWQKREQELRKNNPFLTKFDAMYLASLQRPEELVEAFEHLLEQQRFDEEIQQLHEAAQNLADPGQVENLDAQLQQLQELNMVLNRHREELHELQEIIEGVRGRGRARRHRDNSNRPGGTVSNEANSAPCQHCGRRYSQSTIARHSRSCESRPRDGLRSGNRLEPYSTRRSSRATATTTLTKNP